MARLTSSNDTAIHRSTHKANHPIVRSGEMALRLNKLDALRQMLGMILGDEGCVRCIKSCRRDGHAMVLRSRVAFDEFRAVISEMEKEASN